MPKSKTNWIPYIINAVALINSLIKFANTDFSSLNILSYDYVSIILLLCLTGISIKRFCDGRTRDLSFFVTKALSLIVICSTTFLLGISFLVWVTLLTISNDYCIVFAGNLNPISTFFQSYCHIPYLTLHGCMLIYLISSVLITVANTFKAYLENKDKK